MGQGKEHPVEDLVARKGAPSAVERSDERSDELAVEASAEARGERLDLFLSRALPELTRARLQQLIADGCVLCDGRPVSKPSTRLKGTERFVVRVPVPRETAVVAEALPLQILHEDKDIVVLDKAAGMVVHPAAGNWSGTVVNALLHKVKDLSGIGDERRPGIVHRLDKDTSGCLVIAKHEKALRTLQAAFQAREVEKLYLALVHGGPKQDQGTIRTLYGRHPVHRKRFTSRVKAGKEAVTHFQVRERFDGAALVELRLETGRTHQIRVHCTESGFPLLADQTYGAKPGKGRVAEATVALGRQALHAWKLSFDHPRTGKRLSFEADLPEEFERALELLRG